MLKGFDISKYQGAVNFDELKAGADFVIARASMGCPDPGETVANYTDADFQRNRNEAARVGILFGAYHFGYPQYNDPEPEAQQFFNAIQAAGGLQENVIYALDYEEASAKDMDDWCSRFIDKFKELTGGYVCLLYIDHARAVQIPWTKTIATGAGLWLAEWDFNANSPMDPSTPWPFLAFRQYTDKATVAGITPVDGDVFYGDASAFDKYGYHAPVTTVTVANPPVQETVVTTPSPVTTPAPAAPVDAIQPPVAPVAPADPAPVASPVASAPTPPADTETLGAPIVAPAPTMSKPAPKPAAKVTWNLQTIVVLIINLIKLIFSK